MTCANCSDCSLKDSTQKDLFYEIHFTIGNTDLHNWLHLTIEDFSYDGDSRFNFMTKDKVKSSDPFKAMLDLKEGLISQGYEVVRSKIETVPWHPAALINKTSYHEAHFKFLVDKHRKKVRDLGFHVSRNATTFESMLTYRKYGLTSEKFREKLNEALADLFIKELVPEFPKNVLVEYTLFDDNIDWDKRIGFD